MGDFVEWTAILPISITPLAVVVTPRTLDSSVRRLPYFVPVPQFHSISPRAKAAHLSSPKKGLISTTLSQGVI